MLNRNNGQIRWKTLAAEYQEGLNWLGLDSSADTNPVMNFIWWDKLSEIISPAYLNSSLSFLLKSGHISAGYYPTLEKESSVTIKLPDGTISYNAEFRLADDSKVHSKVLSAINKKIYSLENFDQLDYQYSHQFEVFVKKLQREGIEVSLLLSPYHPLMYRYLVSTEKYQIINKIQEYFISLGREYGIPVYGSYNPEDIDCSEEEFFDEMHVRSSCLIKILSHY